MKNNGLKLITFGLGIMAGQRLVTNFSVLKLCVNYRVKVWSWSVFWAVTLEYIDLILVCRTQKCFPD